MSLPVFKEQDNWASVMKEYSCVVCNARYPALECQMTIKKADDELTELDKYASLEIISIFEVKIIITNYNRIGDSCFLPHAQ